MAKFSVCMSVYHGDNAQYFKEAVESIINQSLKPDEVVLVVDGPVSIKTNDVINYFDDKHAFFKVIRLNSNSGHAIARQTGIEAASNEFIAIMDSDDLAVPNRFEKQIKYLDNNKDCDIVGGQVTEFVDTPSNIVGERRVPLTNDSIYDFIKCRCPFNQPTVMFRKESVLAVGGYLDWHWNEDYYLWIRMVKQGCKMANLPNVLVNMRTGYDQYQRRGGLKYFRSEKGIQKLMLDNEMISFPRFCINVTIRWVVQVMMPNKLRGFVFMKLLRKNC